MCMLFPQGKDRVDAAWGPLSVLGWMSGPACGPLMRLIHEAFAVVEAPLDAASPIVRSLHTLRTALSAIWPLCSGCLPYSGYHVPIG